MRKSCSSWLALAGYLLIALSSQTTAQTTIEPVWVEPQARQLAGSPEVTHRADALLERTLSGAGAATLIAEIEGIRGDHSLRPPERDAVLAEYLDRLREHAPGTAPDGVLDWLAGMPPMAVTGHEEGRHHPVALFNVAGTARGLANEWAWRRGHATVAGHEALSPSRLAHKLGSIDLHSPGYRGMRYAIERLPVGRVDALSLHCASAPAGCGKARADIELARGNLEWLRHWLSTAPARDALPRLKRARLRLQSSEASALIGAALEHPDPGVAAWAISDLTSHLPKDGTIRRDWGLKLLDLLDDPELGGAAALQLSRMDDRDWLEAAHARPMGELGRRRLELMAELQSDSDRGVDR